MICERCGGERSAGQPVCIACAIERLRDTVDLLVRIVGCLKVACDGTCPSVSRPQVRQKVRQRQAEKGDAGEDCDPTPASSFEDS